MAWEQRLSSSRHVCTVCTQQCRHMSPHTRTPICQHARVGKTGALAMRAVASKVINFRAPAAKQALIDHAVEVSGMNRTEFILDAVCEKAREVLADQTQFALSRQALQRFNALLDAPLANNAAIRRLLATPAPWER